MLRFSAHELRAMPPVAVTAHRVEFENWIASTRLRRRSTENRGLGVVAARRGVVTAEPIVPSASDYAYRGLLLQVERNVRS